MLENADGAAEPGTIAPTEKEGSKEGITENHDITTKDVVPGEVDPSKASESTSSHIKKGTRKLKGHQARSKIANQLRRNRRKLHQMIQLLLRT